VECDIEIQTDFFNFRLDELTFGVIFIKK